MADERFKPRCGHGGHGRDWCLLVEGHSAPHRMLDDDYPRTGPNRREYECTIHRAAQQEGDNRG